MNGGDDGQSTTQNTQKRNARKNVVEVFIISEMNVYGRSAASAIQALHSTWEMRVEQEVSDRAGSSDSRARQREIVWSTKFIYAAFEMEIMGMHSRDCISLIV